MWEKLLKEDSVQYQQTNAWRKLLQYQQCEKSCCRKSRSSTSKPMHGESYSSTSNVRKVAEGRVSPVPANRCIERAAIYQQCDEVAEGRVGPCSMQQTNAWRELLQYQQCEKSCWRKSRSNTTKPMQWELLQYQQSDEKLLKELTNSPSNTSKPMHGESCSRSRIHERTISLRFLAIILIVLRLEVSVCNVYNQTTFSQRGGE